jgi:hypothetical protein
VNPQPLHYLLDALARSSSMVPNPDDAAAVKRTAEVLRRLDPPPRVVLVGRDTDPAVETIENIHEIAAAARDALRDVGDHVDDLLRVMRRRRNSPLAEIVRAILDRVDGVAEPTISLPPTDVLALRGALVAWDHGIAPPTPEAAW